LRPVVRGQINRVKGKIKIGRGYIVRELSEAEIK